MLRAARAVAVAAAMTAVVGAVGPAYAGDHAASARTAVYGFGGRCPTGRWGSPAIRPRSAYFSLACENGVRHIRWRDWRATTASGRGEVLVFNGLKLVAHHGVIRLSRVRAHNGRRYFSRLVMTWTTKGGKRHREVLTWGKSGPLWLWLGVYG